MTEQDVVAAFAVLGEEQPDEHEIREILQPDWANAGLVHDWRNYVPDSVRGVWNSLNPIGAVAVYIVAVDGAENEQWD